MKHWDTRKHKETMNQHNKVSLKADWMYFSWTFWTIRYRRQWDSTLFQQLLYQWQYVALMNLNEIEIPPSIPNLFCRSTLGHWSWRYRSLKCLLFGSYLSFQSLFQFLWTKSWMRLRNVLSHTTRTMKYANEEVII